MSRELLERLSSQRPNQPDAYGGQPVGSAPFARARRQNYRDSMLGAQHNNVRRMGAEMGRPVGGYSRGKGDKPGSGQRVDSGQNRPSAGFKEPPGRGYDPFG